MIALSVNINKIATLRNARGGIIPNVIQHAKNIELFGANGITVHPRPDERHITYQDVRELKKVLKVELNIEGNPKENSFVDLVLETKPSQVTLVPDESGQLTSDHGWDTIKEQNFLSEMVRLFSNNQIRTSLFINPDVAHVQGAKEIGADRIELYTESYANSILLDFEKAIEPFIKAANKANQLGIEINAGHDLNLENLSFFAAKIPNLKEVSIGHALISESLYLGIDNVINMYLNKLK